VQYIINSTIVFDSGDGTLRHPDTDDVFQLPLPAQRLLQILLESECEVLTRDFLFREVWDKYGLTGSNSNLNQYLSLLRRSMVVYGCENFVITIPKVGIRLDEHVSIVKKTGKEPQYEIVTSKSVESQQTKKPEKYSLRLLLPGLTVLTLITLASTWIISSRSTGRDPVFTSHTLQTGCVIHTVKSESEYYKEKVEAQVSKLLQENNLACRKGFNVYFDYYTSDVPQTYGRTMLSVCRAGADGVNRLCDNVYYTNRNEIND